MKRFLVEVVVKTTCDPKFRIVVNRRSYCVYRHPWPPPTPLFNTALKGTHLVWAQIERFLWFEMVECAVCWRSYCMCSGEEGWMDNVRVGRVQSRNQRILCTSPTLSQKPFFQNSTISKFAFENVEYHAGTAGYNVPNCEVSFPQGKWFRAVITLFMRHNLMSLILKHNVTSFSQPFQKKTYLNSTWRTNMRGPEAKSWLVSNFVVKRQSFVCFHRLPMMYLSRDCSDQNG